MATRKEIENTRQNVEGLAMMARKLGYEQRWGQLQFNNGATASDLFAFLDDNPGACEAIIDWVLEHGRDSEGEQLTDEEEEAEEEDDE